MRVGVKSFVFINSVAIYGMRGLKKAMGKPWQKDVNDPIATATRNIEYSHQALKQSLCWNDTATLKYTSTFFKAKRMQDQRIE
jgi:hypothetical protein